MAKTLKFAYSVTSKLISGNSTKLLTVPKQYKNVKQLQSASEAFGVCLSSRAHITISATQSLHHSKRCRCVACNKQTFRSYSTEVEKELSQFLDKEIQFESSRSGDKLPKILGFDVTTDGGDVTLTKTNGGEKIVVKLSVNGAVDSFESPDEAVKEDEPPQMVCRPPFHVEITKGGTVLALQCSFPSAYPDYDEEDQLAKGRPADGDENDDHFDVEEVSIHGGEWKDATYSVSSESMDPELFDLLIGMLDERGINEEFTAQLVDFCTAYENKQYITFLQNLKKFAEK